MPGDHRTRFKQWLASGEARLHPLTLPQRELWETSPVPVADPANHICCLIWMRGNLTPREAHAAIQRVVDRQEVLRASFLPGKERPLQMVRNTGEPNFRFRELTAAQSRKEGIEEIAREIFREPFDLVQGPLYRVEMLRRAQNEYVMAFSIHHAIADGWTLGVFVQDLCGAYLQNSKGGGPLPPVPLSYSAWGAAERAAWPPEKLETTARYWKIRQAGSRRLWPPAPGPASLERWVSHLPPGLGQGIRDVARAHGATLFSALLAAFQTALARWTGVDDLTVGTPVANRATQAVRETMGYCAGVIPLRSRMERGRSFSDTLRVVHEETVDAFANAMPFAELMTAAGEAPSPGYHPVYQVRFALQNHPIPDVDLPSLSARLQMRSTGTARFDLGCEITEQGETLELVWLFRASLFSKAEVEEMQQLFEAVLAGACRPPQKRTAALAT